MTDTKRRDLGIWLANAIDHMRVEAATGSIDSLLDAGADYPNYADAWAEGATAGLEEAARGLSNAVPDKRTIGSPDRFKAWLRRALATLHAHAVAEGRKSSQIPAGSPGYAREEGRVHALYRAEYLLNQDAVDAGILP